MQSYPLETGYDQFVKFIDNCFSEKTKTKKPAKLTKSYTRKPISAPPDVQAVTDDIKVPVEFIWSQTTEAVEKPSIPRRIAHKIIKTVKGNHE